MRRIVLLLTMVATALLLASRVALAQDASVEIRDEPDPVQVGKQVTATVKITNTSDSPQTITMRYMVSGSGHLLNAGRRVSGPVSVCFPASFPVVTCTTLLDPNETVVFEFPTIADELGSIQHTVTLSSPNWTQTLQHTEYTLVIDYPRNKEECKQGGYKDFGFKNQGECINAVNQAS